MKTQSQPFLIHHGMIVLTQAEKQVLTYDFKYLETPKYDGDNLDYEPAKIIIDNEAAIYMTKYNKDTAGNRHISERLHYVRQVTALKEHKCEWIGKKFQLAEIRTKMETNPLFNTCGH